ncbi:hypothetical protein JCM10908_002418 [Rhodotorula pacifica]|uniref:uncharacterized protein n=1 Tax=Rhodotorula pacifica TaxID=1495444 RepID=UPI0031784437
MSDASSYSATSPSSSESALAPRASLGALPLEIQRLIVHHAAANDGLLDNSRWSWNSRGSIWALYWTSTSWQDVCRETRWKSVSIRTKDEDRAYAFNGDAAKSGRFIRRISITIDTNGAKVCDLLAASMMGMRSLEDVTILPDRLAVADPDTEADPYSDLPLLTALGHLSTLSALRVELLEGDSRTIRHLHSIIYTLQNLKLLELTIPGMAEFDNYEANDACEGILDTVFSRPRLESLALVGAFGVNRIGWVACTAPLRELRITDPCDPNDETWGFSSLGEFLLKPDLYENLLHLELIFYGSETLGTWSRYRADHNDWGYPGDRLQHLVLRSGSPCEAWNFRDSPLRSIDLATPSEPILAEWPLVPLDDIYNAHNPPLLEKVTVRGRLAEDSEGLVAWCKERKVKLVLMPEED